MAGRHFGVPTRNANVNAKDSAICVVPLAIRFLADLLSDPATLAIARGFVIAKFIEIKFNQQDAFWKKRLYVRNRCLTRSRTIELL